jgi:acetyl esterase/lipase
MGEQQAEYKTYTYKTAEGCEIKLDVYGSQANLRKPVIIWIHGGALIMGSRKTPPNWLDPEGKHVIISIDYRLAPETKLPAIIEDVQAAFRWVHERGPALLNIDAEKLVVAGASAGGYLTLMTGFCVKPRPKALISLSGYGSIVGSWYTQPSPFYLTQPHLAKEGAYASVGTRCVSEPSDDAKRGRFYLYCRQNGIWPKQVTGHDPDSEPKWFDRYCPVRNISGKYPPTLLIHGTADTDVPFEESDNMDKALTRFKVEHEFMTVPGGGHVLSRVPDSERARIYKQARGFVIKHTS